MEVNANQALWEKGDFGQVAAFIRASGEALVQSLGVKPGLRVLDLGCGDGTTALPLAQQGCEVTGVDISRMMVEAGQRRAAAAGLTRLQFQVGDACDLREWPDAGFDLTVSFFGAMFAPRPFDVAREMVRVTRPGGRIVMGNWMPDDPTFVTQLLKITSAYLPPPPGFISPAAWGVETNVLDRFGRAGVAVQNISFARDHLRLMSPDRGPAELMDVFRRFYGPTMNAYEAARQAGREPELHQRLLTLAAEQNRAGASGTDISATFLRVTVRL